MKNETAKAKKTFRKSKKFPGYYEIKTEGQTLYQIVTLEKLLQIITEQNSGRA